MEGQLGFRKKYKMTGTPGNAMATGKGMKPDAGKSGSSMAMKSDFNSKKNVKGNGLKSKQAW